MVGFGSPVEGTLHRGDIITKVGSYDSRDIRHQDAQNLFRNAGNNIKVVVQREVAPRQPHSTGSSRTGSAPYSPLSVSPHLSPRGPAGMSPGYSPGAPALSPYYSSPMTALDSYHFDVSEYGGARRNEGDGQQEPHVTKQVANSVLERISTGDPNKQVIHNLYNSPIGMYSENNIVDSVHKQTGLTPVRKHVKFNPAESETYKALQEEGYGDHVEEGVASQSKVYVPNKSVPPKKNLYVNQTPDYRSALREDPETIQQSGSFKRLMWSVLPESHY
ncbi:unnamed protein product [Brassicogethes aeneus]|uniref:PDZ domain-containing protein n=1 Tax=Brassicogethes aeneus TaxID=1431903 RepID=A0A9P0FJJ2_BRAAE|nr:unnamed protein product [Brassicogethes aeneus]